MEILKLNSKNFKEVLTAAIKLIKKGRVLISPTDTVYGLIADATNEKAVEKIFKIKKRPRSKPLAVFVSSINQAKKLAEISEEQEKILKKYWPGKYTFILKAKKSCLSELLFSKNKNRLTKKSLIPIIQITHDRELFELRKIGIRIPKYKFLNDLLKKINKPLAQTSANISGKPASTKIKEVLKQFQLRKPVRQTSDRLFGGQVDLLIDVKDLSKSKPSKVIDLTGNRKKVLRT